MIKTRRRFQAAAIKYLRRVTVGDTQNGKQEHKKRVREKC